MFRRLRLWQKATVAVLGFGLLLLVVFSVARWGCYQNREPIYRTCYAWRCTRPFLSLEQCKKVCWEEGGRVPYCAPADDVLCCSKDWVRYPIYGTYWRSWCHATCPEAYCKAGIGLCSWCGFGASDACCQHGQCETYSHTCITGWDCHQDCKQWIPIYGTCSAEVCRGLTCYNWLGEDFCDTSLCEWCGDVCCEFGQCDLVEYPCITGWEVQ